LSELASHLRQSSYGNYLMRVLEDL
jgi:hypothetical protein